MAGPVTVGSPTPARADARLPVTAGDGKGKDKKPTPDVNANCTLRVPAQPLSAKGLATPYVLTGAGGGGPCHEANTDQSAFVEASIVNPRTGELSVYHPLVIDQGTQPAVPPVIPQLNDGDVVGLWFGFNGDTLTLTGTGSSRNQGHCVNGLGRSNFGQFAYCNAPAFFQAANAAISKGKLTVPQLGPGPEQPNPLPCPTVRDFGIVDQDQSDNVTTTYLLIDGRTAQDTTANQIPGGTRLANGSDNRLLDAFIDPALDCSPFTAPDLTNRDAPAPSLALNELHAAANQAKQVQPIALIPLNDPMTLVNGQQSTAKTNLYRLGVGQPQIGSMGGDDGSPAAYCTNLRTIANGRLARDEPYFRRAPSPTGSDLFTFLSHRLDAASQALGCPPPPASP